MIDRTFLAHPRSVGETYPEHLGFALSVSGELLVAAGACLVHALIPALFTCTASRAIERLHQRLVVDRAARRMRAVSAPV